MISVRQIKAARALLGWSQSDLAANSRVSERTIKRLEGAGGDVGGRDTTARELQRAFEEAGVTFVGEGEASRDGGEGVRLRVSSQTSHDRVT